ncbi:MAG: 4Fe-4S binding protein [Synergistaceae bacterium]|nr:4Fe-4S binding protein [Synergistaceae bacterium]
MIRKIINIDKNKCIGCGLCVSACDEGAIVVVNGKAELLCEDHCDGLGDCLPVCPVDAILFEVKEPEVYKKTTVETNTENKQPEDLSCGCPATFPKPAGNDSHETASKQTYIYYWPIQIKLMPITGPRFYDADLLFAADCTAFAYGNFHEEFMKNRTTIINCVKFDKSDYSEKLTTILRTNRIKSMTLVRMNVPCCSGIESVAKYALKNCGKVIPYRAVVMSIDGRIIESIQEE